MRFFWSKRHSDNSLNDPLLAAEDGSTEVSRQPGELDDLVARFGRHLLNASPKDVSRLKAAVENDDTEEISDIIGSPSASTNAVNNETEFSSIDISQDSLFKMAVDECKTEWVQFFLEKIGDTSIPFEVGAAMMKESFDNLWLDYKLLLETMIEKDALGWDICSIEVPLETFTNECNMGSRVGTCDTIAEWLEASRDGAGFEHWRSLNLNGVDKVLKTSRERKVNATVRIYCFENVCQIGLDGIIRMLLLHKAPSSLFKTPLIKWVITYKWERIWKVLAFKRLASFLLFFVGFHLFVLSITFEGFSFLSKACEVPLVIYCAITMVLLPLLTLRREYFQLKRSILDGRKIFPPDRFRGIKNYFSSYPNQINLLLSGAIVLYFVALALYWLNHVRLGDGDVFLVGMALELLLIWGKMFYLAQAFKRSGIFIVMIGRVLQECAPYFLLLLGITIVFGLAMHIAFLDFLWMHDQPPKPESGIDPIHDNTFMTLKAVFENETQEENINSFGNFFRSTLTMTYVMIGLFDPEVLFQSGSLKNFMIAVFAVYLFVQSIIMFNILIASMGDAFDGVKAAEEELFLTNRAKYIDQLESSLSSKGIEQIKDKIEKYLYVLIQENEQMEESAPLWKGRLPTIKEDVAKIVRDSQNQSSQNINEIFKTLRDDIKGFNDNIKRVEDRIMTLEKRIGDQESNQ